MGERVTDKAARLICFAEYGVEWEEATEAQREESITRAEELQQITHAPWPTHLPEPGLH